MADEGQERREALSRQQLILFLNLTDVVLDRTLKLMIGRREGGHGWPDDLGFLWRNARERIQRVVRILNVPLSRARRRMLAHAAMFGEELSAKMRLLFWDVSSGAIRRILKRVNSMLDSLADIFPALHAVEEFKDHVEATMDGLREPIDYVDFGDIVGERP